MVSSESEAKPVSRKVIMHTPYIELTEFSVYVIRTAARVIVGVVSIVVLASLVKFVVPKITPDPIVKIQMVEGSKPITLPNGKVLMQCGITGMSWLQMCDDVYRYTLKITGTACNVMGSIAVSRKPARRKNITWDSKDLGCK